MEMLKPYMGALRRSYNPGLWLNYRTSKHHMSVHAKVQRIQVCLNRLLHSQVSNQWVKKPSRLMRKKDRSFMHLVKILKSACVATLKGERCDWLSEASSSSIYCRCKQQRLWRDYADAQAHLNRHLFAYVISTFFSWAGSL